jgi:hypothetical protein
MHTDSITTVRGIVVPADWDDQGRVLKLAIVTFFEDRVMVVPDARGMSLISCLRKTVRVDGILRTQGNLREIEVQDYAVDPPGKGRPARD